MSLISRKMLDESIDLKHTVDTEERYIWRDTEQTITGQKDFVSPLCVSNPFGGLILGEEDSNRAVTMGELIELFAYEGWQVGEKLITEQEVEDGYIEILKSAHIFPVYNKKSFHVEIEGAGALLLGTDYELKETVSESMHCLGMSFSEALKKKVMAGDRIKVVYEKQRGVA